MMSCFLFPTALIIINVATSAIAFPSRSTVFSHSPTVRCAPPRRHSLALSSASSDHDMDPVSVPTTRALTSASGLPVSAYALGGAARSVQPRSLPSVYRNVIGSCAAPYYFYYNPHRYENFMAGIRDVFATEDDRRENKFASSGGTGRSLSALDVRLADALRHVDSGDGESAYLDMFVLEYVCPEEMDGDGPGPALRKALRHVRSWIREGVVRYLCISTHSHAVGADLLRFTNSIGDGDGDGDHRIDAIMLRYNMAHRRGAEFFSFPVARLTGVPVLAFTTTRWNALQQNGQEGSPTSSECVSFALSHPDVDSVIHSPRDLEELEETLRGGIRNDMDSVERTRWEKYGDSGGMWDGDNFDEYPEEEETGHAADH